MKSLNLLALSLLVLTQSHSFAGNTSQLITQASCKISSTKTNIKELELITVAKSWNPCINMALRSNVSSYEVLLSGSEYIYDSASGQPMEYTKYLSTESADSTKGPLRCHSLWDSKLIFVKCKGQDGLAQVNKNFIIADGTAIEASCNEKSEVYEDMNFFKRLYLDTKYDNISKEAIKQQNSFGGECG